MFGATSSSWPGSAEKTSYWPSTRPERYASTVPACTPVSREPIASVSAPGCLSPESRLTSGVITSRRPAMLVAAQSRRSTTRTGG